MKHALSFILIIVFTLFTFIRCNTENTDFTLTVSVDPVLKQKYVSHTIVFDSLSFIALETTPESRFASIDKLQIASDYYIIWDRLSNSILFFSKEGKFHYRINKTTNVNESFDTIHDFAINPQNNELIIKDGARDVLVYYSLKGKKKREQPFPFSFGSFSVNKKGHFYFYMRFEPLTFEGKTLGYANLIETDGSFRILGQHCFFKSPLKSGLDIFDTDQVFYVSNNDLFFSYSYSNSFIKIKEDGLIKTGIFDIPKKHLIPMDLSEKGKVSFERLKKYLQFDSIGKNKIWAFTDIYQTSNGIITFRLQSMNDAENIFFYSPKTKKYYRSSFIGSDNSISFLPFYQSRIYGVYENSFYSSVSSKLILHQLMVSGKYGSVEPFKILNTPITNFTNMTNPVIVKLNISNF